MAGSMRFDLKSAALPAAFPGIEGKPGGHRAKARSRSAQEAPQGGRERKKADKRGRIKAAAREFFTDRGYERTKMREIAVKAGVALGTLSLYAEDKRDLVLLVYNDDYAAMIERGDSLIREGAPFGENINSFFRIFFESYASNLQLARAYLHVNFFAFGMNSRGLTQNRQRKFDAVMKIVRLGQKHNDLRRDIKPDLIAMQLLLLHSSAVRDWIFEERPSVRAGLSRMRRLIDLQTQGLQRSSPARSRGQ